MSAAVPPALAARTDRVDLADPVFISDLHLAAGQPATLQRFIRFCAETAAGFSELVILGDLFEYWLGDDDADDVVGTQVAAALRQVSGRGVAVFLMHGNRDLLLGRDFCARAGATLLADPTQAQVAGAPALLAHGDAWCTLDTDYMKWRAQARNPAFQQMFLGKSIGERRAFVQQLRAASEAGRQLKTQQIMDVTNAEIDAALRASGNTRLLHGHTHRPATHRFVLDGAPAERWVLPDWDCEREPVRGGYLHTRGGWQVVAL